MRAGGGKSKGSAWEREVCKKLSLWLSYGLRDDLLWRSAMSGGRATVAHKKGQANEHIGDISAVTDEGYQFTKNYVIECKFYADIHLDSLLTKQKGATVYGFWEWLIPQALAQKKEPILIFKQNRMAPFILMGVETWQHFLTQALTPVVVGSLSREQLVLCDFDDFLQSTLSPIKKEVYETATHS